MVAIDAVTPLREPVPVPGLPILGNVLAMAKDPAKFFLDAYRKHGPVFKIRILGNAYTVIAGVEAANFMGRREGKDCLRSKEFWQGLVEEYGATCTLTGEDGEKHAKLRAVMRDGYSKEAIRGRYDELVTITDQSLARDWKAGTLVPVVQAMQYMVTEQLGIILTGAAPLEYVQDIRTTILYILNVLVTRQRPKFLLKNPKYKHAKARVFELGQNMIDEYRESEKAGKRDPDKHNLIDDIMAAHKNDVLARVQAESDALFAKGPLDEAEMLRSIPAVEGAIMETMRLYPIAVAQMRTATKDFEFEGFQIRKDEMLYVGTSVPHFMEEYYPNATKFDIDRYQKPRAEHMQPGVYSPYGRGPHACLGKSLAEVQMAISMARLFHKLDMSLDPVDYNLVTKTAPTPGPSMKFKIKVNGYRH
jgi:cytochrome P450